MKKTNKGFTIIEVVLVLAIAGLIFLIVFLALPALQRSQRDTQRRSDLGRVLSAVQTAQSNTNGALPAFDATFISSYLTNGGSQFADPSGGNYAFVTTYTTGNTNIKNGELLYATGKICTTGGAFTATGAGTKSVAVAMTLENGGLYCQNN